MREKIFGNWMSHSFVARMYAWQVIFILTLCVLLWYHRSANAAEMGNPFKPTPANRATEWEPLGKNHWKAQLDDPQASIVTITLRGVKLHYEIIQRCTESGSKREFSILEWNYGSIVGRRSACDGTVSHPDQFIRDHEKNFGPYPDPVEAVLGLKKGRFSHRI